MINKISTIRSPFSTEDLQAMDDVLEGLIGHVVRHTSSSSAAIKHFADDLTDMLVDIKVDLNNLQERTNVQAGSEGHSGGDINREGVGQSSATPDDEGSA